MKIVMVDPFHYKLSYVLPDNNWMRENFEYHNFVDQHTALLQWLNLYKIYLQLGIDVKILRSQRKLPDMVFVANAGLQISHTFILSNFRHPERRGEKQFYRNFFQPHYRIISWEHEESYFEGQGDALWADDKLLVGYGIRTSEKSLEILREIIDKNIIALKLRNDNREKFYHLDTALSYLGNNNFLIYREAFTEDSFKKIENLGNLILVERPDALKLVCNAVTIGNKIILQESSSLLKEELENLCYEIISVDTSEFIKSGGSVKCLTLIID